MEAIAIPLRRLHEEAAWFARATEVKLLHVTADATLRAAALKVLMAQEYHADNRALFFRFDDPMTGPARGWPERVARLRAQVAEKTEALAPAGIHLRPLPDAAVTAVAAGRGAAAELAAMLYELRQVLVPPLTHAVVVLAPARIDDARLFAAEVSALVRARELADTRWIIVEPDAVGTRALAPLLRELRAAALSCSCAMAPAGQADALAALGAASVDEPVTVRPPTTTWRAAGAVPDVEPPPRIGALPLATDEALRAAGLSPMFVKGGGQALRRLVLGAALALRQGKPADAATLQARAAALCAEMEMPAEQVLNLQVLAGYLMAGADGARARATYRQAGEIARAHGLTSLEAQTELALGMLEAVGGSPPRAAAHYAAAGRLAEASKIDALAIEAWRMAGQLALEARLEVPALECWKRALGLAGALDAKLAQATSAPEIARALAAVCRRRGLLAQARALEERSVAFEQGIAGGEASEGRDAKADADAEADAVAGGEPAALKETG